MKSIRIGLLATSLLLLAAGQAGAGIATSLDEAYTLAAESGLPVLLEIGTSW